MVKVYEGTPDEFYMDGYLKTNFDTAKSVIKKDWDMVMVIDGVEGCLTGDTQIQLSRNKVSRRYSLKWLYNHYNGNPDNIISKNKSFDLTIPSYVRSYNGKEIRLHKIKGVSYSGENFVYQLCLSSGEEIKATKTHKFMTRNGWVELGNLSPGDEIMCDTLNAQKSSRKRIKLYDVALPVGNNHPYSNTMGRVVVHTLIYEAGLNSVSFLEYLDILLNEPEQSRNLKFVNPKTHHIHHKDGCHYNNSEDNLELVEMKDHLKYHSIDSYNNFSQGMPSFNKIQKITRIGIEKVYDIECEEPHHNFVANNIIVHNSGKSVFAMQLAKYVDSTFTIDRIVFTPRGLRQAIIDAKQYQAVVYDEGYTGLSSRATMSLINRTLISMLAEIRQRNLFVFVVMPCFFDLDKYVALWRSRALIHVYTSKDFKRGFFAFYNVDTKKFLYITGKKFYTYGKPRPNFIGRFTNHYTVDEAEYRKKKKHSLLDREKKRDEQEKRKELEDEVFNRIMSYAEESKDKIPHKLRAAMMGISESYYWIKAKRWREAQEIE